MTTLLQRNHDEWLHMGGLDTAEEIVQQPRLWRALAAQLQAQRAGVDALLGDWLTRAECQVILTGAGSSAFVGEIPADELNSALKADVRAIATTSLLSHPELYLNPRRPTVLVSFARSGNSPESLGVVELVREVVPGSRFLNITCNAEGDLARRALGHEDSLNLLMPSGSCDRGFAMTSSFSCMLLAVQAVLGAHNAAEARARIERLADLAESALRDWSTSLATLAAQPFDRIVYLGSGPLESLAKEAALKVLELSSGRALALANTALGFRHGPKSALTSNSLVVMLRSCKPVAQRYEQDLLDELRREQIAGHSLCVGPAASGADLSIEVPADLSDSDAWLAPLWLLAGQMLSLHKSAALGLRPDNPFPDGTVNRVVQGVIVYPHGSR